MHCVPPNLRAALARWAQPSTWLILGLALIYFAPALWDRHVRVRPWITSTLAIARGGDEPAALLIRDTVQADPAVSGERLVWMETPDGYRICGAHREDSWHGRTARVWSVQAFFEQDCDVPGGPWRACTKFVVETDHGTRGSFGPFCSAVHDPKG